MSGVIFDKSGNLYGTTENDGPNGHGGEWGTVYELTLSGSGWGERILHSFQYDDVDFPIGGLIFDQSGNLYGTGSTAEGASYCCGGVFELTPSSGSWNYAVLYYLYHRFDGGTGSTASLTMDAAGNLYGTTLQGGSAGLGSVFRLTLSDGTWIRTDLYDFTGGSDGSAPAGGVVLDANGNLYGTASQGGTGPNCPSGCGVVWEITP